MLLMMIEQNFSFQFHNLSIIIIIILIRDLSFSWISQKINFCFVLFFWFRKEEMKEKERLKVSERRKPFHYSIFFAWQIDTKTFFFQLFLLIFSFLCIWINYYLNVVRGKRNRTSTATDKFEFESIRIDFFLCNQFRFRINFWFTGI